MWYLQIPTLEIGYVFHTLSDVQEYINKQSVPMRYTLEFIPVYVKPKQRAEDELVAMRGTAGNPKPLSQSGF